jgi:hypothetical protein
MARCVICGTPGKACGGPSHVVVPDPLPTPPKEGIMAELKRYNFTDSTRRGSQPTILLLNADDAKRLGLTDKDLATKSTAKAAASTSGGSGSRSGGSRTSRSGSRSGKSTKVAKPSSPATAPAAAAQDDGSGSGSDK